MNPFDLHTIHFLNSFAQRSWVFDSLIGQLEGTDLLKGGVIMALFWWAWIRYGNAHPENREKLLFGLISGVFATILARVLALMLPFRVRPLHNLQLNFRLPYGSDPNTLVGWSSFPSDHAALFFCLCRWPLDRIETVGLLCVVVHPLGHLPSTNLSRISLSDRYYRRRFVGHRGSFSFQSNEIQENRHTPCFVLAG
jgi:hypothetical protein